MLQGPCAKILRYVTRSRRIRTLHTSPELENATEKREFGKPR
jgi:hypothetical protein